MASICAELRLFESAEETHVVQVVDFLRVPATVDSMLEPAAGDRVQVWGA